MKHVIICLLCTVLLFGYVGKNTAVSQNHTTNPADNMIAKVAAAATTNNDKKEALAPKSAVNQVGILLSHADDLGTARFKNNFEKGLAKGIKINTVDTAGSVETLKTMFDKMMESKYNLIVLELTENASADYYVDKAGQAGIPMIIIGQQPEPALLVQYPGIYYIGFSDDNLMEIMAAEAASFWNSNPTLMNFEKDDWDLTYSALTSSGFAATGNRAVFEAAMAQAGISTSLAVDSLVRPYDYDLHKEVDQTIIDDSELVFYDSSTEVQQVINYYYDPTEFKKRPKQQLALSVIDDGAIQLVEDGEVLFACGTDTKLLGERAARLAQLLMAGQVPNFQNLEMEPVEERCFYLAGTVVRSSIAPEPIEEETEEG